MIVGELLGRISSSELTEWLALYLLEHEEETQREVDRQAEQGRHSVLAGMRPTR